MPGTVIGFRQLFSCSNTQMDGRSPGCGMLGQRYWDHWLLPSGPPFGDFSKVEHR